MPKALLATLCDDVRREVNNKFSLMGLFGNFNVRNFTQPMPRFHLFARIGYEQTGEFPVSVELRSAEGVTSMRLEGKVVVDPRSDRAPTGTYEGVLDLTVGNLALPGPGDYEFVLRTGNTVLCTLPFHAEHVKPLMQ